MAEKSSELIQGASKVATPLVVVEVVPAEVGFALARLEPLEFEDDEEEDTARTGAGCQPSGLQPVGILPVEKREARPSLLLKTNSAS